MIIETAHLILRPWRDSDRPAFAEQNADPLVMRFLTGVLTREESDAYVDRAEKHQAETGFCKWAVEAPGIAPFIGAVGLSHVKFDASFTPAVEVGWRLAVAAWGQGYATEAANAALEFGFAQAGLDEIVSFTATSNSRSIAVMRRIGMHSDASEYFDHPLIDRDHRLCRHVLYRLRADEYRGAAA